MAYSIRLTAAALACALLAAPVHAQTNEPGVPAQPKAPVLDPKACTDRDRLPHADTPETDGSAPSDEPLSERLSRTDGVICPPPGLDPSIPPPAPGAGSNMPVIPPPGSPGGDPDIRPK
jgi:hypothetical protein